MDQLDTELISAKVCPSCKRVFEGSDSASFCPDDNSLLAITPRDALIGKRVLDKYDIKEVTGSGGWSKVYLANDLSLNQKVAVKVLRLHLAAEPDKVQRFQNEARSVRNLHHPNIAATYDYGLLANGQPFLVMEYMNGITLRDASKQGKLTSLTEHFQIYLQILAGLAEAHKIGVVHRDLKPTNIMISYAENPPHVKILDFGLAKVMMPDKIDMESLTRTGETLGTPPYMSPEQCVGGTIDGRADIYSLGCMLFEGVTGRLPFVGDSPFDVMVKHMREEAPTLQSVCPGKSFQEGLQELLQKCMEKHVEDRYQSVLDLADDLAFVMKIKDGHNLRPHYLQNKKEKKSPLKYALAAGLVLAVIGGSWALLQFNNSNTGNSTSAVPNDELAVQTKPSAFAEKKFGAKSIELAGSQGVLGYSLYRQQQPDKAIPILQNSMLLAGKADQPDPPLILVDAALLSILFETKDPGLALSFAQQVARTIDKTGLPTYLSLSEYNKLMQETASILGKNKLFAEEETVLKRVAFNVVSPKGTIKSSVTQALLPYKIALAQAAQKKNSDAELSFQQALALVDGSSAGRSEMPGRRGNSASIRADIERLILTDYCEFLKMTNHPKEEKEYRTLLEESGGTVTADEKQLILKAATAERRRKIHGRRSFRQANEDDPSNNGRGGP